MLETKCRVS